MSVRPTQLNKHFIFLPPSLRSLALSLYLSLSLSLSLSLFLYFYLIFSTPSRTRRVWGGGGGERPFDQLVSVIGWRPPKRRQRSPAVAMATSTRGPGSCAAVVFAVSLENQNKKQKGSHLSPVDVGRQFGVLVDDVVGDVLHEPVEALAVEPLLDGELLRDVAHVQVARRRLARVEVLLVLVVEPHFDDALVVLRRPSSIVNNRQSSFFKFIGSIDSSFHQPKLTR